MVESSFTQGDVGAKVVVGASVIDGATDGHDVVGPGVGFVGVGAKVIVGALVGAPSHLTEMAEFVCHSDPVHSLHVPETAARSSSGS